MAHERSGTQLCWVLPAAVPLMLILLSYITTSWSWGLMDDLTLLGIPGGVLERVKECFNMYVKFGELKWTHALHCGVAYKVFAGSPGAFHIFKWGEIVAMLAVWGALAVRLTGRRVALLVLPAVALSFGYLYDQFFFLSTHETTGLLFLGLALWAMVGAEEGETSSARCGGWWAAAVAAFILGLGAKETFLAGVIAAGIALPVLGGGKGRWRRLAAVGALLVVAALAYGIFLKLAVSRSYTQGYSFTDMARISANLAAWSKRVFLNHLPWLLAAFAVVAASRSPLRWKDLPAAQRFGLVFSIMAYGAFLGILLPWNTTSYYAGPLGILFALGITVIIAPRLERLAPPLAAWLVIFATAFNLAVGAYTLNRESTYHTDTQDLWQWIRGNRDFQQAARGDGVSCNGVEASVAIPGHANRWWGMGLKDFTWEGGGPKAAREGGARYYVCSPRFGRTDPSPLNGWQTEFYSRFWQVYRREGP